MIGVVQSPKRKCKLLGAWNAPEVSRSPGRKDQSVVREGFFVFGQGNGSGRQVDAGDPVLNEPRFVAEQFLTIGGDVPGFDFAAQILVKHRLEKEVVLVVD